MTKIGRTLHDTLLWTYGRGTWQYDLICILILGFIFLTPVAFFRNTVPKQQLSVEIPKAVEAPLGDDTPKTPIDSQSSKLANRK